MFEQSIRSESNEGLDDDLLSDIDSRLSEASLKMLHDINFSSLVERNTYSGFLGTAQPRYLATKDLSAALTKPANQGK